MYTHKFKPGRVIDTFAAKGTLEDGERRATDNALSYAIKRDCMKSPIKKELKEKILI